MFKVHQYSQVKHTLKLGKRHTDPPYTLNYSLSNNLLIEIYQNIWPVSLNSGKNGVSSNLTI
jgi:hypothetical protein